MRKYLMSKQQFCCNFSGLFVLSSPWRPGRPTCQLNYLNRIEGLSADGVGSLQAVETVGWPAASGHNGLGRGRLGGFDWVSARQLWQKPMETWHFLFTGQGRAFLKIHFTSPLVQKRLQQVLKNRAPWRLSVPLWDKSCRMNKKHF